MDPKYAALPPRPHTPQLDALWALRDGETGAARYGFLAGGSGFEDRAYEDYKALAAMLAADPEADMFPEDKAAFLAVTTTETAAISTWLGALNDWADHENGGSYPAIDPITGAYAIPQDNPIDDINAASASAHASDGARGAAAQGGGATVMPDPEPDPTHEPRELAQDDATPRAPQLGDHVSITHADGTSTAAVVVPHGPLAELTRLVSEIRQYVGAGVHEVVSKAEQLAAEIRAHL
ncbi:MAG TPA: hypothetical protein VHB25_08465 [Gemmatimonadaceae bacterium]|nr:hypothetical protein [Gemmatimonadaceae bacterium]